jgi:hypothetical protein
MLFFVVLRPRVADHKNCMREQSGEPRHPGRSNKHVGLTTAVAECLHSPEAQRGFLRFGAAGKPRISNNGSRWDIALESWPEKGIER